MTKAATVAARRRRKRQRQITMPGGAIIDRTVNRGPIKAEPPADLVALKARARRTGCTVEEARDVLASEDVGRCILALHKGGATRRDLLNVWQGINASWWNYATRCLSITPSPQSAALPMLPEPMQTDQSLRVDVRSGEEKDAAARNVWFAWLEQLMALPSPQRHALRGHLQDYAAPLWHEAERRPTASGVLAVAALAALHGARNGR
jgi:hypothetical protein